MSAKTQHNNILLAVVGFVSVVVIVALIGFFTLDRTKETIQGQVEVEEYRVACKLPGRIVEIRVKEGDFVHKGDTLAILEMPEVSAQEKVTEAAVGVADAMNDLVSAGARKETLESSYQLLQQAETARDLARKTYDRMQRLFDEGVSTAQKRDEAMAAYKAAEAQVVVAKSQYDMVKSGAREQERRAAQKQVQAAQSSVGVVKSVLRETVQKVGELVGMGSPIMTISLTNEVWGSFNVREDQLKGMKVGDVINAYVPAFEKEIKMKVYSMKDEGTYATWKATKANGQYDLKTFEVKAHPTTHFDGLRPGMSLIIKE